MIPGRKEVFASYDIDDDGVESFVFKMIGMMSLEQVFLALYNQRVMGWFKISKKEEIFRNGYINEGWRVEMKDIDYGLVSMDDIKRMITEILYALGYELLFIKYNKILNLKARYA